MLNNLAVYYICTIFVPRETTKGTLTKFKTMPKTKKQEIETIHFGSEDFAELFMKAVENAEKKTLIHNDSITRYENKIFIHETRSIFLIECGQEYQKLLDEK